MVVYEEATLITTGMTRWLVAGWLLLASGAAVAGQATPTPTPAPTRPAGPDAAASRQRDPAGPAEPLVVGETFTIESRVLGESRTINVYAPAVYADSGGIRLPVLYMPDGGIGEDFLHVAGLVQISSLNGTMRPFLLVGIENTERRRDLTGPTRVPGDSAIAPRVGGSTAFRRFLRDELMPVIRERYRTTGETALLGESLAGLFVVETFFLEPGLFQTYIAVEPSLWWNDRELVRRAPEQLRSWGEAVATLYLTSGGPSEITADTRALASILDTTAPPSVRWRYVPMPRETHGTIFHPALLEAFRALFPVRTP
jgi:predicted alpha/beta superfamily hydrolase